jgi:hypothetical protein
MTIKGKAKEIITNTPGPGQYQDDKKRILKSPPAYKMGSASRPSNVFSPSKNCLSTPAPGMYNSASDFDLNQNKNGRGFKFGTNPKLKLDKNGSPGPGQYYIPCSMVHIPGYVRGKFEPIYKFV